jgi:hypothetical protein
MDFSSNEFRRGLVIGIPILIMSALGLFRRWLDRRNAEISAILQRRDK